MKYRVAGWAVLGFLVAAGWGVYFGMRSKEIPIDPIVSFLTRLTCPIGILGSHFPLSLRLVLVANAATYALVGLIVEAVLRQFSHPK